MSQENVETVTRAIDAYNRRDVEAMVEEVDPEVEWRSAWGRRRCIGDTRASVSCFANLTTARRGGP